MAKVTVICAVLAMLLFTGNDVFAEETVVRREQRAAEPAKGCTANSCQNGATCQESIGGDITCLCPVMVTGRFCETRWMSPAIVDDMRSSMEELSSRQDEVELDVSGVEQKVMRRTNELISRMEAKLESQLREMRMELDTIRDEIDLSRNFRTRSSRPASCASPPGRILHSGRSTSRITVSSNGRIAWNSGNLNANAAVVGRVGYTSGVTRWCFRVNGMVVNNGLGVGMTTLPVEGSYERGWTPGTLWAWFSNAFSGGRASFQTSGTAKLQRWQNNDYLTLTLDYEAATLELVNHSTGERKTITGVQANGKPLYLWVFLGYPGHRIIFI